MLVLLDHTTYRIGQNQKNRQLTENLWQLIQFMRSWSNFWPLMGTTRKLHPTEQQLQGHWPPISQTIQVRWTRHAETTQEWHPPVDSYTLTHQCWPTLWTYKHYLNGHWMLCREPIKSKGQEGRMARECQGNLCYQHNLMNIWNGIK